MYPTAIQNLITAFARLPGVGQKTAERYVFFLLKRGRRDTGALREALGTLLERARSCQMCSDFSEDALCERCSDRTRDLHTLCVVADPQDVRALERSGAFRGIYHVLRGVLNPAAGIGPQQLTVAQLLDRVAKPSNGIQEVILALNPDMDGETTASFLAQKLKDTPVKVTRLARGLPLGSDIDYADEITLGDALNGRRQV